MKDSIRVGIVQPKPYPTFDDPRNLGHALQLLERCRGEKLDVVCFPEYFPYLGEEELGAMARQLKSYILAGLVESEEGKLFNTATLIDRSGHVIGRQRKRNVGSLERSRLGISPGDGLFRVFTTDFGKLGAPVCIDLWGQPEAGKMLIDQGADVLFNISLFPLLRGHWKTGALVRAFDNFVPVVGVNTAEYNALIQGKRQHEHGGGSFVIQPPRLIDMDDFRRWLRSFDNARDWVTTELDDLEHVHFASVNLSTARRFRREFWNRFGFQR